MFKPTSDPAREVMIAPRTELQRIAALETIVQRLLGRIARLEKQAQGDEG